MELRLFSGFRIKDYVFWIWTGLFQFSIVPSGYCLLFHHPCRRHYHGPIISASSDHFLLTLVTVTWKTSHHQHGSHELSSQISMEKKSPHSRPLYPRIGRDQVQYYKFNLIILYRARNLVFRKYFPVLI